MDIIASILVLSVGYFTPTSGFMGNPMGAMSSMSAYNYQFGGGSSLDSGKCVFVRENILLYLLSYIAIISYGYLAVFFLNLPFN